MVVELLKVGKIKVQLGLYETQIKNLCVNEPEYLKKLLDNPASALLQVGIDVKNVPIWVKISTNAYSADPIYDVHTLGGTFIKNILVNFFVGVGSYRDVIDNHELPDLIPGPMHEAISEYVHETLGIESKATKTIIFEGYGLKNKKMLSPIEANKFREEERAKRDEKSGKTLLKSDGFKSAFLSYLDTVEFERGQCEELNEFGLRITCTRKLLKIIDFQAIGSFDSPLSVEGELIHELFDNDEIKYDGIGYGMDPVQLRELIGGFDQRIFGIENSYEMEIYQERPVTVFITEHNLGQFNFNESKSGIVLDKYYEDGNSRSCSNAISSSLSAKSIQNVKRFIEYY